MTTSSAEGNDTTGAGTDSTGAGTDLAQTDAAVPASTLSGAAPPAPRRHGRRRALLIGLPVLAVVLATIFVVLAVRAHDQAELSQIRASGLPTSVPTTTANLMQLAPVRPKRAPDFTLTDQNGHTLSLESFRGHGVVLEFMDTHCVDICPIVSQEFVDAYRDLGPAAARTTFVAVNVNVYHRSVSDVASYSDEHDLDSIASWHFFTGPPGILRSVWRDYGVEVQAPSPNADVIHTSLVLFIDPAGHERFLAEPMADHTTKGVAYLPAGTIATWGQGIALVARDLSR